MTLTKHHPHNIYKSTSNSLLSFHTLQLLCLLVSMGSRSKRGCVASGGLYTESLYSNCRELRKMMWEGETGDAISTNWGLSSGEGRKMDDYHLIWMSHWDVRIPLTLLSIYVIPDKKGLWTNPWWREKEDTLIVMVSDPSKLILAKLHKELNCFA